MRELGPEYIQSLRPYVPGQELPGTIKLASNENPYGPSPKAIEAAKGALARTNFYPGALENKLIKQVCEKHSVYDLRPEQVVLGNGSTELIGLLVRALVRPDEQILTGWPSFLMYRLAAKVHSRQEIAVPLDSNREYDLKSMADCFKNPSQAIKLVFLANPNNPTGAHIPKLNLERFIDEIPKDAVLVLDEAYTDYVTASDYPDGLNYLTSRPRTVCLRTFSKIYGLAGLRIAYAACDPEIADLLRKTLDPFHVNSLAQAAAIGALGDGEHVQKTAERNSQELGRFREFLDKQGYRYTNSQANFLLVDFEDGSKMHQHLLSHKIVTRPVANYEMPNSLRISIGTPEEMSRLREVMGSIL